MIQKTLNNETAEIYRCQYCGRETVKPLRTVTCPLCQEKIRSHNQKDKKNPNCFMGDCVRRIQYKKIHEKEIDDFCVDLEAMTGKHGQCQDFLTVRDLANYNIRNGGLDDKME